MFIEIDDIKKTYGSGENLVLNDSSFFAIKRKWNIRFSGDIEVKSVEYRPRNGKKSYFLGDIKGFYIEYRPPKNCIIMVGKKVILWML